MNDHEPDSNGTDPLDDELRAALGHDPTRRPSAESVAAIRALAVERLGATDDPAAPSEQTATVTPIARARPRGRRELLFGAAAAAVGAVAGTAATLATREDGPEVDPAVAAATEVISFTGSAADRITRSELINHTWGVELVVDLADLPPDRTYDVVYTSVDGRSIGAGSFLSVPEVTMKCRFNAAIVRAETSRIEIVDGQDVVAEAVLV